MATDEFLGVFDFGDGDEAEAGGAEGMQADGSGGNHGGTPAQGGGGGKKRGKNKAKARLAREEAEREARMADARRNAGPDRGKEETATLERQLALLGLKVHEVKADGHCLFRAFAHQLPATDASEEAAWALRRKAVAHMTAHVDDYAPFFEPTDASPTFEAYCKDIENSAAWGGQMEIRALAAVLGTKVRVHTAGAAPLVMNEGGTAGAVELVYHQHAFGLGEHYNAAVPPG